jgi:hypothetical protein
MAGTGFGSGGRDMVVLDVQRCGPSQIGRIRRVLEQSEVTACGTPPPRGSGAAFAGEVRRAIVGRRAYAPPTRTVS